jgi:hypothetical protein
MHGALGEMYVQDARFTENLERYGAGVAQCAADAWRANAERQE